MTPVYSMRLMLFIDLMSLMILTVLTILNQRNAPPRLITTNVGFNDFNVFNDFNHFNTADFQYVGSEMLKRLERSNR